MLYTSAADWRNAERKQILLFGMSGLGKTHISNQLRDTGAWFHYSIDYRIGTRYMGELIADNFKREAMKLPALRELLMTDSVYIASNITFNNLAPLSAYLGKPGDPDKGGLGFGEYQRRQGEHRAAEIAALMDTPHFINRAMDVYAYPNFVCDSGGSICEVVDPEDAADPVLSTLSQHMLLIWIKGGEQNRNELIRRFDRAPKPMYYNPDFLIDAWARYLEENDVTEAQVDPDAFLRWGYAQLLAHRQPRYEAMAQNWGITVTAEEVAQIRDALDFNELVQTALERR